MIASSNGTGSNPNSPTFQLSTSHHQTGGVGMPFSLRPGTSLGQNLTNVALSSSSPISSPSTDDDEFNDAQGTRRRRRRQSRSYLEYVKGWNDDEIATWLVEVNAGQYITIFKSNDIRGNVLLDVDQQALKEMGMRSVGDRIKLIVAIKALRQRCITAARMERQSIMSSAPSPSSYGASPSLSATSSNGGGDPFALVNGGLATRTSNGRLPGRIPPPLHLSQSNSSSSATITTEAWQPLVANSSRQGSVSSTQNSHNTLVPTRPPIQSSRSIPPPSLPPPQSHPPLAPAILSRSTTTPAPIISTTAASPTSTSFNSSSGNSTGSTPQSATWSGEYGLPRAPSPGNLAGGVFGRRNTSLPQRTASTRPAGGSTYQGSHRKTPSLTPANNLNINNNTPYGHNQPLSTHPYATPISPPILDSSASNSRILLPSPTIGNPLSPVFEVAGGNRTPTSDGGGVDHHRSSPGRDRFTSTTPPIGSFTNANGMQVSTSMSSLEAVLRKAVKFIGEDGVSKMVAVSDCVDGREVLMRVLRKFQKVTSGRSEREEAEHWGLFRSNDEHARPIGESDLLTICRDGQAPERPRGLVLRRLHSTITSETSQRSQRKLQSFFGEQHTPDTTLPGGVSSRGPTSPNYLGIDIPSTKIEPASPSASSMSDTSSFDRRRHSHIDFERNRVLESPATLNSDRGKTNRASTVSIMSGLGGTEWSSPSSPASRGRADVTSSQRSPAGSFLGSGRKLQSFFGQRPPSELIATHFGAYFPQAEKNMLSKQARQSMRKSMVRRESQHSNGSGHYSQQPLPMMTHQHASTRTGTSWEKAPDVRASLTPATSSRFSGSSMGSNSLSPVKQNPNSGHASSAPITPPLRSASSARSLSDSVHSSNSHLEPPDESAEDDETGDDGASIGGRSTRSASSSLKASRRMSRMSGMSRRSHQTGWSRKSRDGHMNDDAQSMITVDEVTAELETRRASRVEFGSDEENDEARREEEEDEDERGMRPPSIAISSETDEEFSSDEDDDDESDEEEEDDEEMPSLSVKSAKASVRGKATAKWIKGALIGAGSFGSVYLGMNPMNGSLMAVKQVELPTGHSHNEERKKSMLDALEREIELLKVLRHENIVQYLDSSSDDTHLNIFLEYVPGGSVAALLSNYGAFEEALVSKFVRQILTGLEYLHEREIIHRDIKGANILVDNKGGIKISDFGISKKVEDNLLAGAHRPSLQGSVYWMAPEVVKQTAYTSKADIWSLGCLVVEMLTGSHPWANLTQMQAIFRIGSSIRPAIPDDISVEADDFLDSTFLIDHNKRPSAFTLLRHSFVRDEEAEEANNALNSQQTPTRATFHDI